MASKKPRRARCVKCKELAFPKDICQDGYCRDCHVSITFEQCTAGDNAWADDLRSQYGLPTSKQRQGDPR